MDQSNGIRAFGDRSVIAFETSVSDYFEHSLGFEDYWMK